MYWDENAHTDHEARVEKNIEMIRARYSYGQTRDEIHSELVPGAMSEEDFFLAFVAAVTLDTDAILGTTD